MYVYRKTNGDLSLIPKGLYVKMLKMTYNPFGIKENDFKYFYKHTFPSGISDKLEMRHKADNSEIIDKYFSKKRLYRAVTMYFWVVTTRYSYFFQGLKQ